MKEVAPIEVNREDKLSDRVSSRTCALSVKKPWYWLLPEPGALQNEPLSAQSNWYIHESTFGHSSDLFIAEQEVHRFKQTIQSHPRVLSGWRAVCAGVSRPPLMSVSTPTLDTRQGCDWLPRVRNTNRASVILFCPMDQSALCKHILQLRPTSRIHFEAYTTFMVTSVRER